MKNPIARYLMSAYAYYEQDDPLITDTEFDMLAKYILHNYDVLKHPHKKLITKSDLSAGTYLGKYPEMVKNAVSHFRLELRQNRYRMAPQITWTVEKSTLDDFF
jgi:NAD-dependent DNA ligase